MQTLHTSDSPSLAATPSAAPILLTIAGLDPSSGAGITADLKVFAAHAMYGISAATALTVQSTRGVRRVQPVDPGLLAETLACLAEDLPIAGVKIGMLATAASVAVVVSFLETLLADPPASVPVVLDPVLQSTSGHPLLDPAGRSVMQSELLRLVTCVTPNMKELQLLAESSSQSPIHAENTVVQAASSLVGRHPALAVVATGGDLADPTDLVLASSHLPLWIEGRRINTQATHGTGCAYSSALLCGLVQGLSVQQAARQAKRYVEEALQAAIPIGAGGGSMHHLYAAFPAGEDR